MDELSQRILEMDCGIAKKHGKPYHYASQKRQCELLGKFNQWAPSPRTYFRRRRKLEDQGYIRRQKRHRRLKDGTFAPGSTLTYILGKAFYYMARLFKKNLDFFSFYQLPKMAVNMFNTAGYIPLVDKLRAYDKKFVHQRNDATVFSRA